MCRWIKGGVDSERVWAKPPKTDLIPPLHIFNVRVDIFGDVLDRVQRLADNVTRWIRGKNAVTATCRCVRVGVYRDGICALVPQRVKQPTRPAHYTASSLHGQLTTRPAHYTASSLHGLVATKFPRLVFHMFRDKTHQKNVGVKPLPHGTVHGLTTTRATYSGRPG